jgi:Skp family chaperone for outer membrane proteins
MRTIFLAATIAAVPAIALAQDAPAPAAPAKCYIEIQKLFGEPPAGIGELGAAVRTLDTNLRPQVEEINAIRAEIARLEQRAAQPAASTVQQAVFEEEDSAPAAAAPANDRTAEELTRLETQLKGKQDQLKLDYAAQQREVLGPVQARVSRGAQFFANNHGCAEMKMARAPDLAALTAAGARDVTGEFVAWYLSDPPA